MYEYKSTGMEVGEKTYRLPKTHETLDEVMSQMARDGWRLMSTATASFTSKNWAHLTLFWEREKK